MASDSTIDRAIGQLPPPPSSSSSSSSPMTSPPRPRRQGSSRDVLPSHHRPGQLHVHGRTRSISISSRASGFSQEELVRPTLTFADDRGELTGLPGYLARAHRKLTLTPYCLVIVLHCMPRQIHSWHSPHLQESHRINLYGRGSRTSTITRLRSLCP